MTCSRVSIINRGKIVATNTPENLKASLSAGAGYELEIDSDAAAAAEQLLRLLPGVRLIESIPSLGVHEITPKSENRAGIRVISEPGTEPGRDIVTILVGMGVGVYEMRRTRASLEDVFLQLTTEEKNFEGSADLPEVESKEATEGEVA